MNFAVNVSTLFAQILGSMPSDVLRQSRLPLVDQSECAARHGKPTLNEAIICAGGIQVIHGAL